MLLRLLSYHQVPVQYFNLLSSTIQSRTPSAIEHGSFWARQSLSNSTAGIEASDHGRSGRQYEMAFGLKGVERRKETQPLQMHEWSVRSATIYHKFDILHGSSLWLLGKAEGTSHIRCDESRKYGRDEHNSSHNSPAGSYVANLAIHLLLAQ